MDSNNTDGIWRRETLYDISKFNNTCIHKEVGLCFVVEQFGSFVGDVHGCKFRIISYKTKQDYIVWPWEIKEATARDVAKWRKTCQK